MLIQSRSLAQAIEQATSELSLADNPNAHLDSRQLLLHVLRAEPTFLFAHPESILTEEQLVRYQRLIARRKQSEPIQYITGEREFYGLRLAVTPDVLIPRPETEHLVEAALERIPAHIPCYVADVGTGSGAIAIALAAARPLASVIAVDLSSAALAVAKTNAITHRVDRRIEFIEDDLLSRTDSKSLDIVISNPPYIAEGERSSLPAEVKDYEPREALFAGPTGLEVYERLIPQAARALQPGGWLLMEIGAGQQSSLRLLLEGWQEVSFVPDLRGIPRVAIARLPFAVV